ncbi:MAG: DUF551 domain-containing protein [Lachnospiraceae bacterium]|nr:DUF551 domain-containing protein [Lachnospiraceae bacterium]
MAEYIDKREAIETVAFYLGDPDGVDHALQSIKDITTADVLPIPDGGIGEVSDGYHTFNGLYYQRMVLFAALVKQNKDKSWKSLWHEDGELCFGGGWFIVGIDTPSGSYTYHYEDNFWSMFDCQELPVAKHWDGHTEKDVTRLLSLADVQLAKWTPVTERLPNGNGEYLVSGKDKVWVCEFMILGDVGGWCNRAMNPCVEYWMPLPEPPKVDG